MPVTKEFIIRVKYTYLGLDQIKLATEMQKLRKTLKIRKKKLRIPP